MKIHISIIFCFLASIASAQEIVYLNKFQLKGSKNFINDYKTKNNDNTYNAIIEIPAGSNDKWEVSKSGDLIEHEMKDGRFRKINYLGYPFNYGFLPRTILSKKMDGDGDALDVIVLSQSTLKRGSVVKIQIIGMIKMKDKGRVDNKILSATIDSKFSRAKNINMLTTMYPGLKEILSIWFSNYKGEKIKIEGFEEKKTTKNFISQTQKFYENKK
tara:strand:+ start:2599 stop:3243 length:645 start_codon:yes stop_codon:yes gene_type:complete